MADTLEGFIEANKQNIAQKASQELLNQKLLPSTTRLEDIISYILPWVDKIIKYVSSSNITDIKEQIRLSTQEQKQMGVTSEYLLASNTIFYDTIKNLLEKDFAGEEKQAKRNKYLLRLESIKSLSSIAILSTFILQSGQTA